MAALLRAAFFGAAFFFAAFFFAALRPTALRAVLRVAVLRFAAFLALDLRLAFLPPPRAAVARFIAAVAARFIFFKVSEAPLLLLRFLDLAMVVLLVASAPL